MRVSEKRLRIVVFYGLMSQHSTNNKKMFTHPRVVPNPYDVFAETPSIFSGLNVNLKKRQAGHTLTLHRPAGVNED